MQSVGTWDQDRTDRRDDGTVRHDHLPEPLRDGNASGPRVRQMRIPQERCRGVIVEPLPLRLPSRSSPICQASGVLHSSTMLTEGMAEGRPKVGRLAGFHFGAL
jgi:hypothetical protein